MGRVCEVMKVVRGTPNVFQGVSLALLLVLLVAVSLSMSSCGGEDSSQASQEGGGQGGGQEGGKTRTYYIAADPVDWDYAPRGIDEITGKPFNEDENVFVEQGEHRIGDTYRKALYREYTVDSFSELKERPKDQEYLGALGPLVRAEVGDTIKVVFKNNTDFPASLHAHGVFYKKGSEGAPYQDGTSGDKNKGDDVVNPGGEHTYTWKVPERAGPGPNDPSSIAWMYHSHVGISN
jgi:manganese oxidase